MDTEKNNEKMNVKAQFRCARERLGVPQFWIAEEFGVRESTVRHWESPATPHRKPSDKAMELLRELESNFNNGVKTAVEVVEEQHNLYGDGLVAIDLAYYPSQERFKELHPDDRGWYGYANAITREAKIILEAKGYRTRLNYA